MSSNYPAGLSHDSNSKQKREGGTAVRTAAIVWDPYPMYTSLCPLCFRKNIHYLEGGDCLLCPCRQHGTVCAPCSQQSLSSTIFLVERGSFNFYPNQYRLASHYNSPVPIQQSIRQRAWQRVARRVSERFAYEGAFTMSEVQLNQVSSGRDKGEMEELKVRQICSVFAVPPTPR